MAIQDTRMTLNKEKNQSSKEEQKTITRLS